MLRTLIKPFYLGVRQLALRAIVRSGPRPPLPEVVHSLLVITDRRLGDVCVAIPVLQCLRTAYPNANLGIVTPGPLQPLVQWACAPSHLFADAGAGAIGNTRWDAVIDLTTDYHLKPAQRAAATGAPVRIGFDFKGRGRYFNLPLEWTATEPMQDTYARVLKPLSVEFRPLSLPAEFPARPVPEWTPQLVTIHPGAHHDTQRWPAEYFGDLIRRIHGGSEACLVLGAENERELVERVVKLSGSGAVAAITGDVMQLAATIRASEILICNNSGPLHLASLLGVPSLSFMGPTVRARWTPLGSNAVVLRQDRLACIGCNLGYCRIRTHACMREIRPDEAFSAYFRFRARMLLESAR